MNTDGSHFLTSIGLKTFQDEFDLLRNKKIPEIAERIDEAKQQGDLSENAEYHQAKDDMAWAQGRLAELKQILNNVVLVENRQDSNGMIGLGSTVVVRVKGLEREYIIVGPQEADPTNGKISNESPLGQAFIGHAAGDKVEVRIPAGVQKYEIVRVK